MMAEGRRLPGERNWRFEKRTNIAQTHSGPEVTLERAIMAVTDLNWANQSPTMSGLLDSGGRVCNIDLIHRAGTAYTFVELKVADKTPLYAAMEMLQYGVTYLFSRVHAVPLGYDTGYNEILRATEIHLRVLAPADYYDEDAISWLCQLQQELSAGVGLFGERLKIVPVKMDFAFERFPDGFIWSPEYISQEDRQKNLLWALHRRQLLSA